MQLAQSISIRSEFYIIILGFIFNYIEKCHFLYSNSNDDETEPPIQISDVRSKSAETTNEIIDLTEDSSELQSPFTPPSIPDISSTSKNYPRVLPSAIPTSAVMLPLIETISEPEEFENAPTPLYQPLQENLEDDINVHVSSESKNNLSVRLMNFFENIQPPADALQHHLGKETVRRSNYTQNSDAEKRQKELAATRKRVKEKLMEPNSNNTTGKVKIKRARGRPPKLASIKSKISTATGKSRRRPAKNIASKITSAAGVSPKRPDLGCGPPVTLAEQKMNNNSSISTKSSKDLSPTRLLATSPRVLAPTSVSTDINASATPVADFKTKQTPSLVEDKLASKVAEQKFNNTKVSKKSSTDFQLCSEIKTEKVDSSTHAELMGNLGKLDTSLPALESSVPVVRENNLCQLDLPHVRITWPDPNLCETSTFGKMYIFLFVCRLRFRD